MLRNIRMRLAYDGTDFHGWQKQPGQRTVQDAVEQAIRRVVKHQITVIGSGRTDAGVHAAGQVANFLTRSQIPCHNLLKAIGGRLPKDISLYQLGEAPMGFHSTRHATSKLYRYTVHNDPHRPVELLRQRYAYHFWHPLDIDRLQAAADRLTGEHDFISFATRGAERETTVRTILRFQVYRHYHEVRFDVEGTGFLYNQVRNMVGTLLEIGRGHWEPEIIDDIIAARDRARCGPTAPARGLCLQWVKYDFTARFPDAPERMEVVDQLTAVADTDGSGDTAAGDDPPAADHVAESLDAELPEQP